MVNRISLTTERTNDISILLLHGLGGSPQEFSYVSALLRSRGFHVVVPVLPGHGTHYTDLKKLKWSAYVEAAEEALDQLEKKSDRVFVGGLCLGAVLALHLGSSRKDIAGIIPISTTLFLDGWSLPPGARFTRLLEWTPLNFFGTVGESHPFGVKDPRVRKWIESSLSDSSKVHYSKVPLSSVVEMLKLIKVVKANINSISKPVFAIHPREDEITSLASVDYLEKRIDARLFSKLILEDSYHLATIDQERDLVAKSILQFVSTIPKTTEIAA